MVQCPHPGAPAGRTGASSQGHRAQGRHAGLRAQGSGLDGSGLSLGSSSRFLWAGSGLDLVATSSCPVLSVPAAADAAVTPVVTSWPGLAPLPALLALPPWPTTLPRRDQYGHPTRAWRRALLPLSIPILCSHPGPQLPLPHCTPARLVMPGALHNACVLQHTGCCGVTQGPGRSRPQGDMGQEPHCAGSGRAAAMPPGAPGGLCSQSDTGPQARPGSAARTILPRRSSTPGCRGVPGGLRCWWPRQVVHGAVPGRQERAHGSVCPACAPIHRASCSMPIPCALRVPTAALSHQQWPQQPPTGKLDQMVSFPGSDPVPHRTE